jgi:cob(I)alamin adenosyltransferase
MAERPAVFTIEVVQLIGTLGDRIMAAFDKLQAAVGKLNESVDKAVGRVQEDVQDYSDKVADLQAKVDVGGLSAEQVELLEGQINEALAKIEALDPVKPATLSDVGGKPAP